MSKKEVWKARMYVPVEFEDALYVATKDSIYRFKKGRWKLLAKINGD